MADGVGKETSPIKDFPITEITAKKVLGVTKVLLKEGERKDVSIGPHTRFLTTNYYRLDARTRAMVQKTEMPHRQNDDGLHHLAFVEHGVSDDGSRYEFNEDYFFARNKKDELTIEKDVFSSIENDQEGEAKRIQDLLEDTDAVVKQHEEEEALLGGPISEDEGREILRKLSKIDPETSRITRDEFYEGSLEE